MVEELMYLSAVEGKYAPNYRYLELKESKNAFMQKSIEKTIEETIADFWPDNLSSPILCYFDSHIGPRKSRINNHVLGIDEEAENEYIFLSIDNCSEKMPFSMKSYKNFFFFSYSFKVINYNDRGGFTSCAIVATADKKNVIMDDAEKDISTFAMEMKQLLGYYMLAHGKL